MTELIKILQKAFDSVLNLDITDNVSNTANRGEALGLIMKAQVLVSELNNKYKEMF
jgi:hypothetical protein